MDFKHNTGKTIQDAFEQFHKKNPKVYIEFKKLAFAAIKKGRDKISFKMIMNVIRWERFIETEDPTAYNEQGQKVRFKINDAYGSRYARLFAKHFPKLKSKISFRELRSK